MERGSILKGPWNRQKNIFIALGLVALLAVWTIGGKSEQPRIGLSNLKSPWGSSSSPASPATPATPSTPTLPDPKKAETVNVNVIGTSHWSLSGDIENAEFPKGVGFTGNVAVIMEEDPFAIHNFAAVVMQFRATLTPEWEVVILTRKGWKIPQSRQLRNLLASGRVKVRFLPEAHNHFPNHPSVSIFLTDPWLWEQFDTVNRMLMFQPDSMICANANSTIDDFLEWDYIGAPMDPIWIDSIRGGEGHEPHPNAIGFNGGLCLRNPRMFRDIARKYKFTDDLYAKDDIFSLPNFMKFEDHWFMRKFEENPDMVPGLKIPGYDIAGKFSVESLYFEKPLGYHQPHRWQPGHYADIVEWCPEVGMIYDMEMPDSRWE